MAKTKKKITERFGDWFRGMRSELKKVVWPSKKQTVNNCVVVLVTMVVSAVVVWGLDSLASGLVSTLINLFG